MIRRLMAATALLALAACAGSYDYADDPPAPPPETRNVAPPPIARPAPLPQALPAPMAPPVAAPAPSPITNAAIPAPQLTRPPPPPSVGPSVAAPAVAAPPAPRPPPPSGDIVVPGQVERQILPPTGDPRSAQERARDIRAWDSCVMRLQGAAEGDPMRPQLDTPEEICRTSLGMTNRDSVPDSRGP